MKKITTNKNRKTPLIALATLGVVGIIGGTMAYYSQTDTFTNKFNTADYNIKTYEIFNPNDGGNISPGQTVNKDVCVENTGDVPILARVKYTETIGSQTKIEGSKLDNSTWIATKDDTNWAFNESDKYFYYLGVIDSNDIVQHLDSITLNKSYNNSSSTTTKYYGYAETPKADGKYSYSDITWVAEDDVNWEVQNKQLIIGDKCYDVVGEKTETNFFGEDYQLLVTVETIQATDENGDAITFTAPVSATDVATAWNDITE